MGCNGEENKFLKYNISNNNKVTTLSIDGIFTLLITPFLTLHNPKEKYSNQFKKKHYPKHEPLTESK